MSDRFGAPEPWSAPEEGVQWSEEAEADGPVQGPDWLNALPYWPFFAAAGVMALVIGIIANTDAEWAGPADVCAPPEVVAGPTGVWPDGIPVTSEALAPPAEAAQAGVGIELADFPGDAALGPPRWVLDRPSASFPAAGGDGSALVLTDALTAAAYDIEAGRVRWVAEVVPVAGEESADSEQPYRGMGALVAGDTVVLYFWDAGVLMGLDLATGDQRWCAEGLILDSFDPDSPERVVASRADAPHRRVLLDARTGAEIADYDLTELLANLEEGNPLNPPSRQVPTLAAGGTAYWYYARALAVADLESGEVLSTVEDVDGKGDEGMLGWSGADSALPEVRLQALPDGIVTHVQELADDGEAATTMFEMDGQVRWQHVGEYDLISARAGGSGDPVLLARLVDAEGGDECAALRPQDGAVDWTWNCASADDGLQAVGEDRLYFASPADEGEPGPPYAVDRADGTVTPLDVAFPQTEEVSLVVFATAGSVVLSAQGQEWNSVVVFDPP